MSCQIVRNSLSEFLDQRLAGEKRLRVAQHLARCRECATHLEELSEDRARLQGLPLAPVPERVQTQLLVLASRERARWNSTKTLPLAWRTWAIDVKLTIDNLMRPLALPVAGGVVSALFLFSMLVPTFGFHTHPRNDVPIRLYTVATVVEVAPFINNDETVVELYIDDRGQATDYSVQRGQLSPELQADLTRMMYSSRFTPATWFGQPTNGKVLVSFRRIQYDVHG
ncbi:MAG: zf-HC2 domain-containing protein [Bryobacteraceae bacterium]|jgi:hypothetical protein